MEILDITPYPLPNRIPFLTLSPYLSLNRTLVVTPTLLVSIFCQGECKHKMRTAYYGKLSQIKSNPNPNPNHNHNHNPNPNPNPHPYPRTNITLNP